MVEKDKHNKCFTCFDLFDGCDECNIDSCEKCLSSFTKNGNLCSKANAPKPEKAPEFILEGVGKFGFRSNTVVFTIYILLLDVRAILYKSHISAKIVIYSTGRGRRLQETINAECEQRGSAGGQNNPTASGTVAKFDCESDPVTNIDFNEITTVSIDEAVITKVNGDDLDTPQLLIDNDNKNNFNDISELTSSDIENKYESMGNLYEFQQNGDKCYFSGKTANLVLTGDVLYENAISDKTYTLKTKDGKDGKCILNKKGNNNNSTNSTLVCTIEKAWL